MIRNIEAEQQRVDTKPFKNLAENKGCDPIISGELAKAGITEISLPSRMISEVPASKIGLLIKDNKPVFQFTRAWYYWVAEGEVPLEIAKELWNNPIGKKDVRTAGFAGNTNPDGVWLKHYDSDGIELKSFKELEDAKSWDAYYNSDFAGILQEKYKFVYDPRTEAARSVINLYHIDSQEGLNLFVSKLRESGEVA